MTHVDVNNSKMTWRIPGQTISVVSEFSGKPVREWYDCDRDYLLINDIHRAVEQVLQRHAGRGPIDRSLEMFENKEDSNAR